MSLIYSKFIFSDSPTFSLKIKKKKNVMTTLWEEPIAFKKPIEIKHILHLMLTINATLWSYLNVLLRIYNM